MAMHASILAWRIPWTEESDGPQFIGLQRVRHHWGDLVHMDNHSSSTKTEYWNVWCPQRSPDLKWSWHGLVFHVLLTLYKLFHLSPTLFTFSVSAAPSFSSVCPLVQKVPRYLVKQYSGMSVRLLLDEISRLRIADCSSYYGGAHPISWRMTRSATLLILPWVRVNSCCLTAWMEDPFFLCLWTQTKPLAHPRFHSAGIWIRT